MNNARPITLIPVLATAEELAVEIGSFIRLIRTARMLSTVDLANASNVSVDSVEILESGQGGDLLTFLRIVKALHLEEAIVDACRPLPVSLDEIERLNDEVGAGEF